MLVGNQLQRGLILQTLARLVHAAAGRLSRGKQELFPPEKGSAPPSPRSGGGWMPATVGVTLEDMKLS